MERMVAAVDGRTWRVQRVINWRLNPARDDLGEYFEDGLRAFIMTFFGLVFLWLLVRHLPSPQPFTTLTVAALLLYSPVRWVLLRPWTITATTSGGWNLPAEEWSGVVRGRGRAVRETRIISRSLRTRATPEYIDSPLRPAD